MRAKDIMSRDVLTVTPSHSIAHASRIMVENGISGLPVVDDDGLITGILTEGDLMNRAELGARIARGGNSDLPLDAEELIKSTSWRVGDVMTSDVVSITEETPVRKIAELLQRHDIKRLPVVQSGKPVGIVSRANLLNAILNTRKARTAGGDAAILTAIRACLRTDTSIDPDSLDIRVVDGHVELRGEVNSEIRRQAARVVCECVGGVAGVRNLLEVVDDNGAAAGR